MVSLPDPIHREPNLLPRTLSARDEGARQSSGGPCEKCPTRSCRLHLDLLKRGQDACYRAALPRFSPTSFSLACPLSAKFETVRPQGYSTAGNWGQRGSEAPLRCDSETNALSRVRT